MITKYSIGSIIDVKDGEKIKANKIKEVNGSRLVICSKCGIQHLIENDEIRKCCGETLIIKTN